MYNEFDYTNFRKQIESVGVKLLEMLLKNEIHRFWFQLRPFWWILNKNSTEDNERFRDVNKTWSRAG